MITVSMFNPGFLKCATSAICGTPEPLKLKEIVEHFHNVALWLMKTPGDQT